MPPVINILRFFLQRFRLYCYAHSQEPTPFEKTVASRKEYKVFDLTRETPLVTSKENDKSGKAKFLVKSQGVWELTLDEPLTKLERGRLVVSVRDRQGNINRIERTFSVGP